MPLARYVVRVAASQEDAAAARIRALGGDAVGDCFALRRQMPHRAKGEWGYAESVLFPGYAFLACDDPERVADVLRRSTGTAELLVAGGAPLALTDGEASFVSDFGGVDHLVRTSRGRIEDGRLVVESGPLAGREGLVRHLDRHRRAAWLDLSLLHAGADRIVDVLMPADGRGVKVGLEVVSKS